MRPIIPGVFLQRYLGRLLTYFDELNAVLPEIDHSFILAKNKEQTNKQTKTSYERENFNPRTDGGLGQLRTDDGGGGGRHPPPPPRRSPKLCDLARIQKKR